MTDNSPGEGFANTVTTDEAIDTDLVTPVNTAAESTEVVNVPTTVEEIVDPVVPEDVTNPTDTE